MIIIVSDHHDKSTNDVIKWLTFYGVEWVRINEDDDISFGQLLYRDNKIEKFEISVNGQTIDLTNVKSYWYRRGWLNNNKQRINRRISAHDLVDANIHRFLSEELENLYSFIHRYLVSEKIALNSYLTSKNDKTYFQYVASQVGLKVPDTLICTTQEALKEFSCKGSLMITKSINELFTFNFDRENYHSKTYFIEEQHIEDCETVFYPTLLQSYVSKFLEVRIFYLNGELDAMAIFSQQNEKTKLDFRNYDSNLPNRNIPILLPAIIQDKIKIFMKQVDLNSGSIDMILTPENEFIFLEVNPVGQFGMVSSPCNYFLEKRIATYLYNYE